MAADGGFTLIELLVVVAIMGILIAFIAPSMSGTSLSSADSKAQAYLNSAAATAASIYSQTQSYACDDPTNNMTMAQLDAAAPALPWDTANEATNNVNSTCNVTNVAASADTIAVYSWTGGGGPCCGAALSVGNPDTATLFAVTAGAPSGNCWFIIMHSEGQEIYGYVKGSCATAVSTCWGENVPYTSGGCFGTLQTGTFPIDPNL